MDTRKYDKTERRALKKQQRTPAYRELQRRAANERTKLEATIKPLKNENKKLAEENASLKAQLEAATKKETN